MTISEAIAEFRDAANSKGDGITPARKDHALHARMSEAFADLASHDIAGEAAFASLLHDDSPHVRSWVAAQRLAEGDTAAVPVMEELATSGGIRGFTAATTLKEFRSGRLRSPFKPTQAEQAGAGNRRSAGT